VEANFGRSSAKVLTEHSVLVVCGFELGSIPRCTSLIYTVLFRGLVSPLVHEPKLTL